MPETKGKLLCIKCQKEVADYKGEIDGITTWFAICSECLYGVKGWTRKDFKDAEKQNRMNCWKINCKRKLKWIHKEAEHYGLCDYHYKKHNNKRLYKEIH